MKTTKKLSNVLEKTDLEPEKPIKWLKSRDVCKMFGISNPTLQSMRSKGLIPAYKLGQKLWFYNEAEIHSLLLKGKSIIKNVN